MLNLKKEKIIYSSSSSLSTMEIMKLFILLDWLSQLVPIKMVPNSMMNNWCTVSAQLLNHNMEYIVIDW